MKTFDLLRKSTADNIQSDAHLAKKQSDGRLVFRCQEVEYGAPEVVTATGRAKCRRCGLKIKKGALSIKFLFDFNGCGSWTATQCHMHYGTCGSQS